MLTGGAGDQRCQAIRPGSPCRCGGVPGAAPGGGAPSGGVPSLRPPAAQAGVRTAGEPSGPAFTGRCWPTRTLEVEPNFVCHRRLSFEQPNAERYGWDLGPVQPALSAGTFYFGVVAYNSAGTRSAVSSIVSKTIK